MTMFGSQWLANAGGAGYEIDQSIRFDSVRNSDLTRTLSGDGNLKTGTLSFWMKRSGLGALQEIFTTYSIRSSFFFNSNDTLSMQIYNGSGYTSLTTTAVFRDPSAFAHYLFRWDTTQATDTDRLQFYYNNVLQTVTGAYPAQNSTTTFSDATYTHVISGDGSANTLYEIDGYLAEIHYVDGTALAATEFGEYNSDGVWVPIEASPTYGTNGFYITGEDSADLGADYSGNSNDFTSAGLTTADQMLDTPTDNYSIFNPVASCNVSGQPLTISDGNLRTSAGGTSNAIEAITQIGPSSGKWYAEFTLNTAPQLSNQYPVIGVIAADLNITGGNNVGNSTFRGYVPNGNTQGTGSGSYGDTFTTSDVIGCAIDLDNQKIWWSKNGTFQNSGDPAAGTNAAFTNLTAGLFYRFCISHAGSTATDVTGNFGQTGGFTYTPPTGFNALSTANLPTPSITDGSAHFETLLYAGSASVQSVTGVGFSPDMLWIKNRSAAASHTLFDKVRGAGATVYPDLNNAEDVNLTKMQSFDSDGFTLGGGYAEVNTSGNNFVSWNWYTGGGTGSSNTDGDITSTVSANPTSGFSVLTYSGNGSDNQTIGHGLGIAPKMIISKRTDTTGNWTTYHDTVGINQVFYLNLTNAPTSNTEQYRAVPTSSVYTIGVGGDINASGGTYVAYVFAEIPGYSSIGSYEGNSSTDGTFVYTGFKPAFILTKNIDTVDQWGIRDATRNPFNVTDKLLNPNASTAETSSSTGYIDILSNGFKPRSSDSNINTQTIIYMAFAENPFGGDGVAPATAR